MRAPEALVQGEHDLTDLTESLAEGFMADKVVRSLAAAELGHDLTPKHKALQDGSNFLSQAIRDVKQERVKDEVLNALLRTKVKEEELPPQSYSLWILFPQTRGYPYYLFISPEEVVDRLESYKSTLDNLQKGTIDIDQVKKARRFFSHFARVQLERSRELTCRGF